MRRVFPDQLELDESDLADEYAYPSAGRWVRASAISSIDGAAQGPDRLSGSLGTDADRRLLALLRGLADVVLVGAGTVRAEGYAPVDYVAEHAEMRRRRGRPPTAPIAVVSRTLDLEPTAPLFTKAEQQTIVVTTSTSPADRQEALAKVADVVIAGEHDVEFDEALAALDERGMRRVLCEGGPSLLAAAIHDEAIDELCLTISPKVVGGPTARIAAGRPLDTGNRWELAHVIDDASTLLTRWTRIGRR